MTGAAALALGLAACVGGGSPTEVDPTATTPPTADAPSGSPAPSAAAPAPGETGDAGGGAQAPSSGEGSGEGSGGGPAGGAAADRTPVDVVTSYGLWDEAAQQVQVAGYAARVEAGGTCTLVVSSATGAARSSAAAVADATTTSCGMLAVGVADLPGAGPWQAVLQYDSPTSSGESAPMTIGRE